MLLSFSLFPVSNPAAPLVGQSLKGAIFEAEEEGGQLCEYGIDSILYFQGSERTFSKGPKFQNVS